MTVYLDASVVMAALRSEPGSDIAQRFLRETPDELFVSEFGRGEVASAIARLVRMKEYTEDAANRLLRNLDEWLAASVDVVSTSAPDIRHAAQLVRRFELRLRMPDAIHLASALALRAQLATFDQGMARAALALGIELADMASDA